MFSTINTPSLGKRRKHGPPPHQHTRLKTGLTRTLALSLAALFLLCASPALAGVDVEYTEATPNLQTEKPVDLDKVPANSVYPGTKDAPSASGNTVTINYSTKDDPAWILGGLSATENVTGNTIHVNSVKNANAITIAGGYTQDGPRVISGNIVNVNTAIGDGTQATNAVYGGYYNGTLSYGAPGAAVRANIVNISTDANLNKVNIVGGYGDGSKTQIDSNIINIDGNAKIILGSQFAGGHSGSDGGSAYDNKVNISGKAFIDAAGSSDVHGARIVASSESLEAYNNSITFSEGARASENVSIYGARSAGGAAYNNRVVISSVFDTEVAVGAYVYGAVSAGNVYDNSVLINAENAYLTGYVYGGSATSNSDAFNNTVTLAGSIKVSNVGSIVTGGQTINGNATGNTLHISENATALNAMGGNSTGTGNANKNTVHIGGDAIVTQVHGGAAASGDANNNTVYIYGNASISGALYGGFTTGGNANNNTVIISGTPNLSMASILGGYNNAIFLKDGNTLNVVNFKGKETGGVNVKAIDGFENYNFVIGEEMAGGGEVLKTGNSAVDLTGANIAVNFSKGAPLASGTEIKLFSNAINTEASILDQSQSAVRGITVQYGYHLEQEGTNPLSLVIDQTKANPRAKALSMGRVASALLLNQGADLLADAGMGDAMRNALAAGPGALAAFTGMAYSHMKQETGSDVTSNGFNMLAGLAGIFNLGYDSSNPFATLLAGIFVEFGLGSYDSSNSFSGLASVDGDGDTEHYGLGVMARFDSLQGALSGAYVEASLRLGRVKTDFSSSDLRDSDTGEKADYDSSASYYGAHLGLGYQFDLTEQDNLDFYAKYFWTRQGSDSVRVADDKVKFDTYNSHRVRVGARYTHQTDFGLAPFAGLAYEYEFDGKAKASSYGLSLDAPKTKGGTAIIEAGARYQHNNWSNLSLDAAIRGHIGKRDGVSANLGVRYTF
ncbi:autotransporter outer membrane beta-barrel domain-containing protein [Desulfovibrio sp. OttesenSCG-928-C14]|nr:autotransporter outer membrane beta-barrel domain-containing protein [Desulfovibrio sp. OttesenSCG-928-C14]